MSTLYKIPADQWASRELNADRLEDAARAFFDASPDESIPANSAVCLHSMRRDDERVWWHLTGWTESLVAGAEVTICREWLVVKASQARRHAFYDAIKGDGIISSVDSTEDRTRFTPAERKGN